MEKIIDKIKKLLALANSPNENEAKLASKKAHELLMIHNISIATIEKESQEFKTESTELEKRQPVENKFIHTILAKHFFVQVIHNRVTNTLDMIGTKENIEVALYIKHFLSNAFKNTYKTKAKEMNWTSGKNRNSFYLGLFRGIMDQLEEQKKNLQEKHEGAANALLVIDKALQSYIKQQIPNLKHRNQNASYHDGEAVKEGYEQGKNLRIARGLNGQSDNSNKFLGGK